MAKNKSPLPTLTKHFTFWLAVKVVGVKKLYSIFNLFYNIITLLGCKFCFGFFDNLRGIRTFTKQKVDNT